MESTTRFRPLGITAVAMAVVMTTTATAEGPGTGEGTLTGSFPYITNGSYFPEVSGTATMPVLEISASDSGSDTAEMSFVLGDTSQVCGQILTNWDLSFTDLITSFGWEPSINTQMNGILCRQRRRVRRAITP